MTTIRITRISLLQTSKVCAALYFAGALIGAVLFLLASLVSPAPKPPYAFVIIVLVPFFYAFVGFVFTFVAAWIYNQVARLTGGIEYSTVERTTAETRDF